MSAKNELIHFIKSYNLNFRSAQWEETIFLVEHGMYSDDICSMLLDEAKTEAERIENEGNFLWRPPTYDELIKEGKPDIEIGNLIESQQQRFGIRFIDRPRNGLIVGGSGVGKTICGLNLCKNIDATNKYQANPTLLIIINPKGDFGHLKNLFLPIALYSPVYGFKIGLNNPINTVPYQWITEISISLAARLGLISSRTTLTKIIAALLILLNPSIKEEDLHKPSLKKLIWPPLKLVLEVVQDKRLIHAFSAKDSYSQTLSHALEGLIQDSGTLLDCCNGFDINEEILSSQKKHIIIDVPNTAPQIVHIIIDIIICQLLSKRLAENYKTDHTDIVFLFEEADLLLSSDLKNFSGELSPLDKLHRLGRELGLMSILSVSGI